MPNRYSVATLAEGERRMYGIYDNHMEAFCTLPDSTAERPNLLPLEWDNPVSAQSWLERCYTAWARHRVPAPRDWAPYVAARQPWDTYRSHDTLRRPRH